MTVAQGWRVSRVGRSPSDHQTFPGGLAGDMDRSGERAPRGDAAGPVRCSHGVGAELMSPTMPELN